MVAHARDADARGRDRAAVHVQRGRDANDRVVRRGVVVLRVRRFRRSAEGDAHEHFARRERRLEHAGHEAGRRLFAHAALPRDLEGRIECEGNRGVVARGVAVGERAAERSAIADLRIAHGIRGLPEHGRVLVEVVAHRERRVLGRGSDREARPVERDAGEIGKPADVDEYAGFGQAQLHHRNEAVAAGEDLRIVAVLGEGREGFVERTRTDVLELARDHACAFPLPVAWIAL